jgi:hypothetical protein
MTCKGIAGILPRLLGILIAVNLILKGKTEFILIPRFVSTISTLGKETVSITLVKTGVLSFIVTLAINL